MGCCVEGAGGVSGTPASYIRFTRDTVQELSALTTANGVRVGDLGCVLLTGNIYRAYAVDGASSSWAPADGSFHAKDFGAIGDFATDDTANLQAWLDEMDTFAGALGGGALGFADAGDYIVSAQLDVGGETTIVGAGRLVSRFFAQSGFAVFSVVNVSWVKFVDLGIAGDGQSVAGGVGIDVGNGGRVVVEDVHVTGIQQGIVFRAGSENCRASRCFVTQCETGIEISDASNATHLFACRITNALTEHFLIDAVSQCNLIACEAEGIAAGQVGFRVAHTADDAIANRIVGCRTEGPDGTGVLIEAITAGRESLYTVIEDLYETGGVFGITDNGRGTRVIVRARHWRPLVSSDPIQTMGDNLLRLNYEQEGASPVDDPQVFNPVEHDLSTGLDGDPIILRRNIVAMHCGSNDGVTAATVHYQAWQGETGSGVFGGAQVQQRMPRAGRVITAGVVSDGDLGSTLLEVFANGAGPAAASDTQTVGAGAANGATYELSSDTADQHFAAGDTLTIGLTPTNTVANDVIMVELIVEYDMRPGV